jgi:hypothetical protein
MNKFVSWQTNGPQDHNIILNQLLDHPLNLQENLRQRSFIVASEWFQGSISRTCFPVRQTNNQWNNAYLHLLPRRHLKSFFSCNANKFIIIIFNEDNNHNSKD